MFKLILFWFAEMFNEREEELCECPVPCKRIMYETMASYAETSKFDTDKILASENTGHLEERFKTARETTQRVDLIIVEKDFMMVNDLAETAKYIKDTFKDILMQLNKVSSALAKAQIDIDERANFHERYGLNIVKRAVTYGFATEFETQEANFDSLVSGNKDFIRMYNTTILKLLETSLDKQVFIEVLEWQLQQQLNNRKELLAASIEGFTKIHHGLQSGTPLLNFDISFHHSYDQYYIPTGLLHIRAKYQNTLFTFVQSNLHRIEEDIQTLDTNAKDVIARKGFNETKFETIVQNMDVLISNFDHGQRLFKREIIVKIQSAIEHKIGNFNKACGLLHKESTDFSVTLKQSSTLIENAITNWVTLESFIISSERYLYEVGRNKTELAELAVSEIIQDSLQRLSTFFIDIRSRARNLQHDWRKFTDSYSVVWNGIKNEETTQPIYRKLHHDFDVILNTNTTEAEMLWNIMKASFKSEKLQAHQNPKLWYKYTNADSPSKKETDALKKLRRVFGRFSKDSDMSNAIRESERIFFEAMNTWMASLKQFQKGGEVDVQFFK